MIKFIQVSDYSLYNVKDATKIYKLDENRIKFEFDEKPDRIVEYPSKSNRDFWFDSICDALGV